MQIVPITSPAEFAEIQNLEAYKGSVKEYKRLLNFATTHGQPCLLSFLPNIDCEKVGYQDISIAEYVMHHNAKSLIYAPCSPDLYDAKGAYMEVFTVRGGPAVFFGATTLTSVSMRLIMELIVLFDLTAEELHTLCTVPCRILSSEHFRSLSIDLLKNLPSNNDVAKKLEEVRQKVKDISLPMRLVKAKRLMFIDVIHAFRAMGVDPYAAVVAIAKRDDQWFKNCQVGDKDSRAFDLKTIPAYLMDLEYPAGRTMDTPAARVIENNPELDRSNTIEASLSQFESISGTKVASQSDDAVEAYQDTADRKISVNAPVNATAEECAAIVSATPTVTVNGITATAPTSNAVLDSSSSPTAAPQFKVNLLARICVPCEADAWDNDNPNRSEPGYKWETCGEEVCKNISDKLTSMDLIVMSMAQFRSFIEAELQYPCHAKVSVDGCGFKLSLQF